MDYKKIYDALVEKCKVRGLDKTSVDYYTEIHHIVPKCLGGGNEPDNLVMFNAREHFIAHMLLWKAYPENVSLMRAAHIMSSRWTNEVVGNSGSGINSKIYSRLREEYAEAVRVQMTENNPWKGKSHSERSRAMMREWHAQNPNHARKVMASKKGMTLNEFLQHTADLREKKKKHFVRDEYYLVGWKANNDKYMDQYKYNTKVDYFCDDNSYINGYDAIGNLNKKVVCSDDVKIAWSLSQVYKDYWVRSNSPGNKKLQTEIEELAEPVFSSSRTLSTMVGMFENSWEPSQDPKFICLALNLNKEERDYVGSVSDCLKNTLSEVRENFFSSWIAERDSNRKSIEKIAFELNIQLNKNSSKNKLSLTDAIEANILWKTGFVEKKQIADLFGLRPNTISQATSEGLRFKEVTSRVDEIFNKFYGLHAEVNYE